MCLGAKKKRLRAGRCHSSTGRAEARWLSRIGSVPRPGRLGGSRRCRTAHAQPQGGCPAPARAQRPAGRAGCQADKQLAPVLRSTLLDPDFSPLAQRQVIVSLSRAEQLLAGSTAPGTAESGRWWLGEVRTYPEGRQPGKSQWSRERDHGDPGWLHNREGERSWSGKSGTRLAPGSSAEQIGKLEEQSASLWARTERGWLLAAAQLHCCWWGNPVLLS